MNTAETPDDDPRTHDKPETKTTREVADQYLRDEHGLAIDDVEDALDSLSADAGDGQSIKHEDDWAAEYHAETIEAVAPTEATAGVTVTRYDLSDADPMPEDVMVEIHQHFPPEDDVEGDSVYIHGRREALETVAALSNLLAGEFEEVDWSDDGE